MQHTLRDYQVACLDAHYRYFRTKSGNPLFVVPTGGGKSLIIAEFVRRVLEEYQDQRVIILTHVKELIEQNHAEFVNQWGLLAPVGIYSAGMKRRDTNYSVIFAGIQSVWPRLRKDGDDAEATEKVERNAVKLGKFDLVLIDEAHLCPKSGEGRYLGYLAWLRKQNPKVKILGYTATPFRLEGGLLHQGKGRIFTDIAYDVPLRKLVSDNYLVPLVSKMPKRGVIDTEGVGTVAGEFNQKMLEESAIGEGNVGVAVDEMIATASREDRRHWLVFACGVDHGEEILERVRARGIEAEIILGTTPKEERARIVRAAKAGEIMCLVNVGVLTTGFNWPRCDLLAVMRPTQSTALYVQIMGRGMRTFPGKENCLVLDYGENVLRHGPVNDILVTDDEGDGDDDGEPLAKVCPNCAEIVPRAQRRCDSCGFEFPKRAAKHTAAASELQPVDFNKKPVRAVVVLDVNRVAYQDHLAKSNIPTLRVDYWCGMRCISEWVCLEHTGFALRKASGWWLSSGGSLPVPRTIPEALDRQSELRRPDKIVTQEDGKYERVIERIFSKPIEAESAPTIPGSASEGVARPAWLQPLEGE